MIPKMKSLLAGGAALLAIPALFLAADNYSKAADHNDPPGRVDPTADTTPDRASDISDVYAWHTADKVIIAMGFAGPQATSLPAIYDRNVLYTLNLSNAGSRTDSEFVIKFRFGQDPARNNRSGVQISGIPGVTGTIEGPVETTLTKDGVLARAALFDDPFFFDAAGFRETQMTGTLSIRNDRDFFRGKNTPALILEIPRDRLENGTNLLDIWGTASRIGG